MNRINLKSYQDKLLLFASLLLITAVLLSQQSVVNIDSGHAGVLYKRFGGTVTHYTLEEGINFILPWNKVITYDVRIQEEAPEEMHVLSKDGLSIGVSTSYRYRLLKGKLGVLHQSIGSDYLRKVITPQVCASVRTVIGKYTPEELYATNRDSIQDEINEDVVQRIGKSAPGLTSFLGLVILNIHLPEKIVHAIEQKLKQQQISKEYEFKIIIAKKEAKRKKIEAEGERDYLVIVSSGLSEKILQWKDIEAMRKLAESENAKIVIRNSREGNIPILLSENIGKKGRKK